MTKVIFNLYEDAPNEIVPTNGRVIFSPSHVRKSDGKLITMNSFTMYAIDGGLSVELDPSPTPGHWAWNIEIIVPGNETVSGLYVVPFGEDVLFTDLVELDPESLEPTLDPEPAWWAMALSTVRGGYVSASGYLILTHTDGAETNAGNVKGEPGEDGDDGDDGTNGTNGDDGADGVSVQDAELDPQGNLILTLSNGFVDNVGRVKGEPGNDGADGDGLPTGGAPNDLLVKTGGDDLTVGWTTPSTSATAHSIMKRNSNGDFTVNTPTSGSHPTNKNYVDSRSNGGYAVRTIDDPITDWDYGTSTGLYRASDGWPFLGFNIVTTFRQGQSGGTGFDGASYQLIAPYQPGAGDTRLAIRQIGSGGEWGEVEYFARVSDLADLESAIEDSTTNIATNSSDISSAESEISALTASVATNTGDIGILQTTTGDNTGDIATINDALPSFQGNAGEWVNVTPEPNYPAQGTYNPQTRRLGDGSIQFWGGFDISALPINKSTIIGTVNAAHVPVDNAYFIAYTNKGYASIRIGADGAISCTIPAAAGYVIIEQVMAGK